MNRFSYEGKWDHEDMSEAAHGRLLWALGFAVTLSPADYHQKYNQMFADLISTTSILSDPHSISFAIMGLSHYLSQNADPTQLEHLESLTHHLVSNFQESKDNNWPWFTNTITWGSAHIARSLIIGGNTLKNQEIETKGKNLLKWLIISQINNQNQFNFIGNKGWFHSEETPAVYDQQPIEAMAMVLACLEAYRIDESLFWIDHATRAIHWFLGDNINSCPLYDKETGGCFDGLTESGVNMNRGSESTLAWLISAMSYKMASYSVSVS
ncbi:MAG: hypothetical protein HRT90_10940 [Candidatus Margulisbacteria bacterium]|nr:hypothetical protein [Candidatus Margulisiibacteriota bacterium]